MLTTSRVATRPRLSGKKKEIAGMMPIKRWLTSQEACSYVGVSVNTLKDQNLTVSAIGSRKYYRVSELDGLIEKNIIINQHG